MHSNVIWRAFLTVIFVCTLWYTTLAIYRYHTYNKLSGVSHASSIDWKVIRETQDRYILESDYIFPVDKESYRGHTLWKDDKYINEYAAKEFIQESKHIPLTVWYDPYDPSQSSLEKHLPIKEIFSSVFLWGLFLYFLWIGFYAGTFKL